MSDERRANAGLLGDIIGKGFGGGLFTEQAAWTDAQWDAHDREIDAQKATEETEADAQRQRSKVSGLVSRGFSRRSIDAALVADLDAPAIAIMRDWSAAHPREGIAVLSGLPGCGKTVAATWWGLNTEWASCVRAATFATASRYDQETRKGWMTASALVLDDLGSEYADAKGSFLVDLDELIDIHYGNRDRMVITTNCTADEFKNRYGSRIVDRLRECGSWLSVGGASMRKKS